MDDLPDEIRGCFDIKMPSHQSMYYHDKDKAVLAITWTNDGLL